MATHPKCKGYTIYYPEGEPDYECGYNTSITCDECRYDEGAGGRGKDPAAKRNQAPEAYPFP